MLILGACSSGDSGKRYQDLIIRENLHTVQLDTNLLNERAVDNVISGSTLQQQKKYAESILEFQQAFKYDSSASILYAMARSYMNLNMYDLAFENILKALNIKPSFIPAMELLTELYIMKRNVKDAILVQKEIINLDPSRNRKLYLAGLYEYLDIETAIKMYEDLNEEITDKNILMRIANLYERKGDSTKLLDTYEQLIKFSADKPQAYDLLMRTYLKSYKYPQALDILDSVKLNFSQDDISYFYNVFGNYLIDDTSDRSIEIVPEFLKRVSNNFYFDWRINMISGYLADKANDSGNAEIYFNRAMKADSNADVFLAVSLYYTQKDKSEKAFEILEQNEKDFSDNPLFPLYKAFIWLEKDSIELALTELRKANYLDSSNLEIWGQLGYVYDRLKMFDSCDFAYQKVLKQQPDNPLINNNYAYSLVERDGDLKIAEDMSKRALSLDPDNSSFLDTYGWIQYKLGNYDIALEYLLRSTEIENNNSEVYEHLGYVYLKQDKTDMAIDAWEKVISIDPDNTEILELLTDLKNE